VYSLVNRKNIRPLVGELLGYLLVADEELRPDITAKLCMVTGRFAPSKKWHVDTILRVMLLAGQYIPEDVIGDTVALVTQSTDVQPYAVRRFYSALKKEPAKKPLVYVAVWFLGEFGDLLVQPDGDDFVIPEQEVVEQLARVLTHPLADEMTRIYALTALGKVAARFGSTQQHAISTLLETYKSSIDLEVQTRAVEFGALIGVQNAQLQRVMDRVPPLVLHGDEMEAQGYSDDEERDEPRVKNTLSVPSQPGNNSTNNNNSKGVIAQLIDLEGLMGNTTPAPSTGGGALDFLSSLMPTNVATTPSSSATAATTTATSTTPSSGIGGGLDALLDLTSNPMMGAPVVAPPPAPITVFDKNHIKVVMQFAPQPDGVLFVQLVSTTTGKEEVKSFTLLMAVPTYVKLQMAAASGNVLVEGGPPVTQQVRIENTERPHKPTLVKVKVDYVTVSGGKFTEVVNVAAFPSHL
jgi:AP-1 complex subunit gamma-1